MMCCAKFAEAVGSQFCREIKAVHKTPCEKCVESAVRLVCGFSRGRVGARARLIPVEMLSIREYIPEDLEEILGLFYDTVHSVNARDYSPEELDAWAGGKEDWEKWNMSLLSHLPLVAEFEGGIVGFGDIAPTDISTGCTSAEISSPEVRARRSAANLNGVPAAPGYTRMSRLPRGPFLRGADIKRCACAAQSAAG